MTNSMFAKIIYQKRWVIFWWFIGMMATTFITTIFFPAFKGTNIGQVFNSLPSTVQHFVGNANTYNTISGYISQEVFGLRAPLMTIILGIVIFNSLTVGEERKGILETHISLPLSRTNIFLSKLFGSMFIITIASVGLFAGVYVALILINYHYSLIRLFQLVLDSSLLGLLFGLVTLMLNAIFGIRGIVLGLSCTYAFLSYLLTSLVISVHSLIQIEKVSLFHYYNYNVAFSFRNLLILIYIGMALIVISFIFFIRRDIET